MLYLLQDDWHGGGNMPYLIQSTHTGLYRKQDGQFSTGRENLYKAKTRAEAVKVLRDNDLMLSRYRIVKTN